ncbi:protein-glutamate methylesterase/protein-glutamine glutaminase [Bacillus solimangrovi]|uniref:Protein-glutamate methylesterase/protein-glutamine glutaminase n=1 Tax=Bacillus solimangrovi TaxID=1305675 RepID=A0A1E5LB16_9BACI|nr:chemotaxis response regulator protein-glutamate methylesterase [Bacillus solimangrovi]OEH91280.1 chemotaxis response regulator protein-glutamate methylesterase [Bacillus solimangrovi]
MSMTRQVSVLIVDDSAFMRKLITDLLSESTRIKVIGTARNGREAVKKVIEFKPDVVTMDVEMPIMNGLDALQEMMKRAPVPVVMLSSTTQENAANTMIAMQNGAVDFIAKPSGAISLDLHKVKEELIYKVITASKANILGVHKNPSQENITPITLKDSIRHPMKYKQKIICIGTSTGGPRALQNVLTKLPSSIDAPILIVQHMPAGFTKSLADRLDSLSQISVKEAVDGDIIKKGTAYIAPGGYHLKLKLIGTSLVVQLNDDPPKNGHRPSVDVMYESVSYLQNYFKLAVIMTGMGTDGAKGLHKLVDTGSVKAIAESKESSVVYGMPKAAVDTGLIDEVAHVDNIANLIIKHIGA